MSNRRKVRTVWVLPTEAQVSLAQASLRVQAIAAGKDSWIFDRAMKRRLRRRAPAGSMLVDHLSPHARQENCGKKCKR